MMRSFKKFIATLLLTLSILVPAFTAQAETLNAMLKYSIYDLYTGEFIQDVNFLTHSSKDASIVQTVQWFNDRGIMMDPKRFNLKINTSLTEYSTSAGNISAYSADIMVYTTEAEVLKGLGVKSETEPGVRNVIEFTQYEPEAEMRKAWEQATNAVPADITANVESESSTSSTASASSAVSSSNASSQANNSSSQAASASSNEASSANAASRVTSSSQSAVSGSEINTPAAVGSSQTANGTANENAGNTNRPTNNNTNRPANQNQNQANNTNQQAPAATANSSVESRSEAAQTPVKEKNTLPKTGEATNYGWLVALVFVFGGIAVLLGYGKTRKQ